MLTNEFNQLKLPEELLVSLTDLNYQQMTPVQAESLPAILAGRDVIVQARTGSGKTAAFALGLLAKLNVQRFRIQGLVICPTRELAEQVAEEIRKLCRTMHNVKVLTLCGGVPVKAQIISLEHGAHILVGTPGRLLDHLEQQRLDFSELHTLVLDEADRMLEMGFQEPLAALIDATPAERQTLLFSATYPAGIERMAASLLRQPLRITVTDDSGQSATQQRFFALDGVPRDEAAMRLLQHYRPGSCLVFCNTKREAQELADSLKYNQFSVLALHGDLEQKDRDQTLVQFSNQSACVLVATDVAARGLDINGLDLVINLQPAHDTDTHIHRIGRTGRAGEAGLALTLVGPADDYKFRLIEDRLDEKVALQPLPGSELLQNRPLQAPMVTIQIQGGKKHKLRPGDIVGALTKEQQLEVTDIGKIQLQPMWSYVAITRDKAKQALSILNNGKIKGRSFRARAI
ncbi:DEAD/DEAH box helicase [Pseudidiomarina salinarum]|uniref:DEAD/DEAH box helicase n=1 Tax=Pseudidiomarina salinarum TaxID=435908 RepID=A0A094JH89_9GAMM|nr:DEAD/DEAH box helicase [Pseudidiomarina salinarum]RUO71531.1 ATP-dependent RNA helicase DbpA [Pseudidiomarina salinarum]